MLEVLLEHPVTIGLIGAVLAIATFYAWMQTGIKPLLPTSLAIAAATVVLVLISCMIDTPEEVLRRFVYETARELEANQYDKVLSKIHPQASGPLQSAKLQLPEVHFTAARIKKIHEIRMLRHRTGINATISMNAYIEAERGHFAGRAPRWIQLTLEQSDGKWLIVDFTDRDPHYQMLNEEGRRRLDAGLP